jgi:hypothetical protein
MDNRLIRYLVTNVIVSALTALLVLVVWNRLTAPELPEGLSGSVTATQAAAPSATQGDFSGQLVITSVIGAGSLESERVRLEHAGDRDLSLEGWRLEDEDGNRYSFPALVLHTGGALSLFSRSGDDSVIELYWDRTEPVWESGEQAVLIDPEGDVQAEYSVP